MTGLAWPPTTRPLQRSVPRGCALAAEHSYREAARLLGAEVGATVDHRAVWRWVQADGSARLRERAERIQRVFGDGEAPQARRRSRSASPWRPTRPGSG